MEVEGKAEGVVRMGGGEACGIQDGDRSGFK